MQTQIYSKINLLRLASYLFNFGMIAGLATVTLGLISCGGGGGGAAGSSTASGSGPTITSITPYGIVASAVPKALSILGTNFTSGMNLTIASSSGVPYTITASSVTSSTVLAVSAVIAAAPIDNYVIFSVQKSSGTPATAVLGVAITNKTLATDIQPIFAANCQSCHGGNGGLTLNSTTNSANYLIFATSLGCSSKFRVTPGDPRRASSVLIDKLKVTPTGINACNGNLPMPMTGTLTAQEIQDIVDWVAGGAN